MEAEEVTANDSQASVMEDTQIAHLAGVIDAIGAVTLKVVKDTDYRLDYTLHPMVNIRRPVDDDPLLGKMMAYCEERGVKYSIFEESHGANIDSSNVKITIKGAEDVRRFLEPMIDYLVSKYVRAEVMLSEIVPAIEDGKHLEKESFYELVGIKDDLRDSRTVGNEPKYTQEYFAEEWSLTE